MRISKVLAVALPLTLAGCNGFFGEDSDNFYAPPPPPVVAPPSATTGAPSVAPKPKASEDCGCPQEPAAIPSSALPQSFTGHCTPMEMDPAWFPSEGHLVYAGDLVMELKRSKHGINPSHEEMAQYLQANMKRFPNMGVTAVQAEKVLEELGL